MALLYHCDSMLMTLVLSATLLLIWWWLFYQPRTLAADNAPEEEDDALVQRAQKGDRHAFNRLVGRYQGQMYAVAFRIVGDGELAADATQDAFLAAYKKLSQYTSGNFRAWLTRVVKNQCFDMLRYRQRRPATSLDDLLLEPNDRGFAWEQDSTPRPDEVLQRAEVSSWLERAIQQLPVDQRTTLVLSDIQEYSYEEIADMMDVELGTVKSRLFRARRKLRELLQDHTELLPPQFRS